MENYTFEEFAGMNCLNGLDLSQYKNLHTYIERPDDFDKKLYDEKRVLNHAHFYEWDEWENEDLNEKMNYLHRLIMQEIVDFCKHNSINADYVSFGADHLMDSIKVGKWHPGTDSGLVLLDENNVKIIESV